MPKSVRTWDCGALPLIALFVLGCSSPTFGNAHALMVTDAGEYQLEADRDGFAVTIGYTYNNRTGRTVSVPGCGGHVPPILQKNVEGEWVTAWGPFVLDCGGRRVIPAGSQYRSSLEVEAAPYGVDDPRPSFKVPEVAGVYRLVWLSAHWMDDRGPRVSSGPVPLHERASNAFRLLAP